MKMKTLKPLYIGGKTLVEGSSFETGEQHARELMKRGYAEADDSKADAVVDLAEATADKSPLISTGISNDSKPATKAKATEKKKAE